MSSYYQRRRRQEIKSTSDEIRETVSSSLAWIWMQVSGLLYLLISFACLLRYLNFVPCLLRGLRRISDRTPSHEEPHFGLSQTVVYRASIAERLVNFFKSEQSKRDFLLSWVQNKIPDQEVRDFTSSWCSGIALCALAEKTSPGTCPRYDLLLPDQAVNNCRLAMKLIRKNYGIGEPLNPEVMAHPLYISEETMVPYISMIRYASMVPRRTREPHDGQTRSENTGPKIEDVIECLATGSGLVTAIVGRKAKFNIAKPSFINKKLVVEIEGPNGEKVRRSIEEVRDVDCQRSSADDLESILSRGGRYQNKPTTGVVDLDYQKIKEGYYQISYMPSASGSYTLSVLWGGEHTTNSPFTVNVVESKSSKCAKKSVSFSSNTEDSLDVSSYKESSPSHEGTNTMRERRHSLFRQSHVSSGFKDSHLSTTSSSSSVNYSNPHDLSRTPSLFTTSYDGRTSPSAVLNRSGSILSSSGDRQGQPRTRRRIIKRVVKGPDGKDEVYYPCSTDRSMTQRSSTMGSLSLSLSVSCDDRFSPNPSRSPSPSPVFLAPVPTLASLERQINRFADLCSQNILGSVFYDLSKDVVFAATKRESTSKVLKVEPKEKTERPSLTETQDTTSSSFLDGFSIKTDSIVDDVFETNTSCDSRAKDESTDQYEVVRPISDSSSSVNRYPSAFRRPRYESETYFRPIPATTGNSDITHLVRNSKLRSRSESDNPTPSERDNKLERELIPSTFSCFKPILRKFENTNQSPTDADFTDDSGKVQRAIVNGHLRHPKLKSRKRVKKEVVDRETQCSADEIKQVTGWINRRERFKSVHHMKEVESKDFIFSKDRASMSLLGSVQEDVTNNESNHSEKRIKPVSKVNGGHHVDLCRTRAVSEPSEHNVHRPQVSTRSKSFGKQSTFDSGYFDENGQNGSHQSFRPDNSTHAENAQSPKRSSPDGVTQVTATDQPMTTAEAPPGNLVSQVNDVSSTTEAKANESDSQNITSEGTNQEITTLVTLSDDLNTKREEINHSSTVDKPHRRIPNLGILLNGYISSRSDTLDKAPSFNSYWEELLYHLENDPKFPVQEFISRIKNISMDIDCQYTPPEVDHQISKQDMELVGDHTGLNNNIVGTESKESKQSSPVGVPTEASSCRAQGCGLQSGIVGNKNNFQVNTQGAGDGSLGVSIRGPRKHTVTECSVIYTGDDFYEVLYEVSLAGFYVISVKWSDRHISDSPFIVKVSF